MGLQGLTLINPATCYGRSRLAHIGTNDYSLEQLIMILRGNALPSVIDTPVREACIGRVAFCYREYYPF
jgi:hypothetical protein